MFAFSAATQTIRTAETVSKTNRRFSLTIIIDDSRVTRRHMSEQKKNKTAACIFNHFSAMLHDGAARQSDGVSRQSGVRWRRRRVDDNDRRRATCCVGRRRASGRKRRCHSRRPAAARPTAASLLAARRRHADDRDD